MARSDGDAGSRSPAGESFGMAAARVLESRSADVFEHARGVLDTGDVERLHEMRVATRRLRAALEVYRPCFPKGRLKATLADVKDLTRALGERRDRDVAILAFEEFAAETAPEERAGIERLIGRLREEQEQANRALAQAVHGRRLQALRVRLEDLAAEARRRVEPDAGPEAASGPGADAGPEAAPRPAGGEAR